MAKNRKKYIYDGKQFKTKKDYDSYLIFKDNLEKEIISSFEFSFEINEETNTKEYLAKNIKSDNMQFESKADAEYYIYLQKLKKLGKITDFTLEKNASKEKTKYLAKKVQIDGHLFDSKAEADYYIHLLNKKRKNEIKDFSLQPRFTLQPSFKKNGKTFRKIEYIADFEIINLDDSVDVVDVKGMITSDFSLKLKMFEFKFPEKQLLLMKYVQKYGGWVTLDEWKKVKKNKKKNEKKNEKKIKQKS